MDQKIGYKTLESRGNPGKMEERINDLAKDGWKLITNSEADGRPYLIFWKYVEEDLDRAKLIENLAQGKTNEMVRNPRTP